MTINSNETTHEEVSTVSNTKGDSSGGKPKAINLQYKDRLFKHPIHTEFTKSYNRLYGRIRRGKLPEDTPLMDELKALHDEYYMKYENTHRQNREAVWREYIEKNRELLA